MWVLDDLEKKEWSKHSYKLHPQWENVVLESIICVGVCVLREHYPTTLSMFSTTVSRRKLSEKFKSKEWKSF